MDILVVPTPHAFKFVENAIVFVQIAKFPTQMVVDGDGLHRSRLHIDVPYFERQVVS